MKDLTIEVCACSSCVMKGAMDIIDSIENLNDVKEFAEKEYNIEIKPVNCIGTPNHGSASPVVRIGDQILENATAETVMAQILDMN